MQAKAPLLVAACTIALLFAYGSGGCIGFPTDFVFLPLEFPFANPGDIVRIAAFDIPNWSGTEPHNGIDLILDEHSTSARIVSPTAGVVTAVTAHENQFSHPAGQLIVTVAIRVNAEWAVNLVLEPGSADAETRVAQLAAVLVTEGQTVAVGAPIADLLVGPLGYPHLHYLLNRNGEAVCAYANSSDSAQAVFESLTSLINNNLPDGNICYSQP